MSFLKSFQNKSDYSNHPFDHWELNEPLTDEQIKEICERKFQKLKLILMVLERLMAGQGHIDLEIQPVAKQER